MTDGEKEQLIGRIRTVLRGIDQECAYDPEGYWETSKGADFGAVKLREIEALIRAA